MWVGLQSKKKDCCVYCCAQSLVRLSAMEFQFTQNTIDYGFLRILPCDGVGKVLR